MDVSQNLTNTTAQEVAFIDGVMKERHDKIVDELKTDWRHDAWVDFRALNGTLIDYDENAGKETVRKMSIAELAGKLGVTRETLYAWEKSIPNFWDRVNQRQKELAGQRRVSFMRDKFYIKAMSWDDRQISLTWLEQNDPNWRDPKTKMDVQVTNSWASLVAQNEKTVIEGEVVEPTNNA